MITCRLQPLPLLGAKGKGKPEISINADIDGRAQSPGYYRQTEAATKFKEVRHKMLTQSPLLPSSHSSTSGSTGMAGRKGKAG